MKIIGSVCRQKFPENNMTGMYRDGDMLVLTMQLDPHRRLWKTTWRFERCAK